MLQSAEEPKLITVQTINTKRYSKTLLIGQNLYNFGASPLQNQFSDRFKNETLVH